MKEKLKIWGQDIPWEEAENQWEQKRKTASKSHPIKQLRHSPKMVGITSGAAKNLKWKSFKYMVAHDKDRKILKGYLRHPIKYAISYLKSLIKGNSYQRDGDFFLYGVQNVDQFKKLLEKKETLLIVGFSYCHKPFECPSGRFSTKCIQDSSNPVCRQCYIGKTTSALPKENVIPLFITTIHYIGEKIFEIVHANPQKRVLFIITACELTLEMFSDWGNMVDIKGIGIRLGGRICNTMKAFELSEEGIKPGLTIVEDETQKRFLELIRHRSEHFVAS